MLYIIGGTSRSGKSIATKQLSKQLCIPYISLDYIVMGFTNGMPEVGINDKLFPDEIARKLWSFLLAMCENIIWSGNDYIIEGEAILPIQVNKLIQRFPDQVKACFTGFCDIEIHEKIHNVKAYSQGDTDWLVNKTDRYILEHIGNMVEYSKKIKSDCNDLDIRYYDTSFNFSNELEKLIGYLAK